MGEIKLWANHDYFFLYQQSSTDIWHAVCSAVKAACSLAKIDGEQVKSIGFAATCSLGLYLQTFIERGV